MSCGPSWTVNYRNNPDEIWLRCLVHRYFKNGKEYRQQLLYYFWSYLTVQTCYSRENKIISISRRKSNRMWPLNLLYILVVCKQLLVFPMRTGLRLFLVYISLLCPIFYYRSLFTFLQKSLSRYSAKKPKHISQSIFRNISNSFQFTEMFPKLYFCKMIGTWERK